MVDKGVEIAPAEGKLGVLLVGLGAVSTTLVAGVEAVKRGISEPIGSLTQMGTIRLGKRTERSPLIKDFVPHVPLDIVFGGRIFFTTSSAAMNAGVLGQRLTINFPNRLKLEDGGCSSRITSSVSPRKRQDRQEQDGLAEQLIDDAGFGSDNNCDRLAWS